MSYLRIQIFQLCQTLSFTGNYAISYFYLLRTVLSVRDLIVFNVLYFIVPYHSHRTDEELSLFTWKRPFELSSSPSLYVDGTSRRDVIQGILGDCWLLSTCAAIAKREDLLHRVLSPKQVALTFMFLPVFSLNRIFYIKTKTVILIIVPIHYRFYMEKNTRALSKSDYGDMGNWKQ